MWLAWAGNCESSSRARSTTAERTFNSYDTAGRLVVSTLYHNPVNPVLSCRKPLPDSYNARSEVTGATRRWGTPAAPGDLVLGQQYTYEFDLIGNRITSAEGDSDRTASYTANELNQHTQRSVPDEKDLIGTAPTNVTGTVN